MRRLCFSFGTGLALLIHGCLGSDCDRSGCDARERPADGSGIAQGVAGVVSSESDVVANGCQECSLSQATLHVWSASLPPPTKEAAVALMKTFDPLEVIDVDEHYAVELMPGDYLICQLVDDGICAAFSVGSGDVATVHLLAQYGPSDMVVFDPGSTSPRTDGIFRLEAGDLP